MSEEDEGEKSRTLGDPHLKFELCICMCNFHEMKQASKNTNACHNEITLVWDLLSLIPTVITVRCCIILERSEQVDCLTAKQPI